MKRTIVIILLLGVLLFKPSHHFGNEPYKHQLTLSFTLSGAIFTGVGYSFHFDEHHAIQATFHCIPYYKLKEQMFALNTGYNYYFGNKSWHPNIGGEFMIMFGPADKEKKIGLFLFNVVPGIRYDFNDYHSLNGRIWVANFLSEEYKVLPIGIEFKYGYNLNKQ